MLLLAGVAHGSELLQVTAASQPGENEGRRQALFTGVINLKKNNKQNKHLLGCEIDVREHAWGRLE